MHIRKLNLLEKTLDVLFYPIMLLLSDALLETPQRTHRWNNHHLDIKTSCKMLKRDVEHPKLCKDPEALTRYPLLFHAPLLGGWRKYIVVSPDEYCGGWHVGWISEDGVFGVSRIEVRGPVRCLRGPGSAQLFAFSADDTKKELSLVILGEGIIGDEGRFSRLPLL